MIAVYGNEIVDKLKKAKILLVGAGGLGSEYLKAFSLMGLGCGQGQVAVVDQQDVESCNLNGQLLFRANHVGKPKSVIAGEMAA